MVTRKAFGGSSGSIEGDAARSATGAAGGCAGSAPWPSAAATLRVRPCPTRTARSITAAISRTLPGHLYATSTRTSAAC